MLGNEETRVREPFHVCRAPCQALETMKSPIEFAAREARLLNCNSCHGQIELVPPLDIMGGKLKPEWAAAFIGGEPMKVRADKHPKGELWVEARMPSFASRARWLAEGMAMQQGYRREIR